MMGDEEIGAVMSVKSHKVGTHPHTYLGAKLQKMGV